MNAQESEPKVRLIQSGGQTGADRAALDFAVERGIPYAGWCPREGWAEDHPRPPGLLAVYPNLVETPTADPAQRTLWNVRDSDATLIFTMRDCGNSQGTDLTARVAQELGRPFAIVDISDVSTTERVCSLVERFPGEIVLNVAGPRESECPGLYYACFGELNRVSYLFVARSPAEN